MSNEETEWFLCLGDAVAGPLAWEELQARVRAAHAEELACVRAPDTEAWKTYKAVAEDQGAPCPSAGAPADQEALRFCETAVRVGLIPQETATRALTERASAQPGSRSLSIYAYMQKHDILTVDQIATVVAAQMGEAQEEPAGDPRRASGSAAMPPRAALLPKFSTLFPFRIWIAERPLSLRAVRGLALYVLWPILIAQLLTANTTLGDVIWGLGIYFGAISGYILYLWLRPHQAGAARIAGVAAFTALVGGSLVFAGQSLPVFRQLYAVQSAPHFLTRAAGCVFGTGILEEGVKALPLYWLFIRKRNPARLEDCAFLGAVSGLALGVAEAVLYSYAYAQQHATDFVNVWERYREIPQVLYAVYMVEQMARLISLPLLHALWTALLGIFIGLGARLQRKRAVLVLLGLGFAALLHGLYNATLYENDPYPKLAIGVALLTLFFFVVYSRSGDWILARLIERPNQVEASS